MFANKEVSKNNEVNKTRNNGFSKLFQNAAKISASATLATSMILSTPQQANAIAVAPALLPPAAAKEVMVNICTHDEIAHESLLGKTGCGQMKKNDYDALYKTIEHNKKDMNVQKQKNLEKLFAKLN